MAEHARVRGSLPYQNRRSAMGRARDAAPDRPYVYRGGDREPPEVTAARERHRELDAERDRLQAEADARLHELIMAAREARKAREDGGEDGVP
jgi:hypothetical protein